MSNAWAMRTAQFHFRDARRKALLTELLDMLRRQPNDLLSLDDVRARLNVRGQRWLGHQIVPVDHIIGSEGRYTDFDRQFLPRSDKLKDRWSRIDSAMIESITLPPVDLYKIGDAYFVRDGNHRVSVARQQVGIGLDGVGLGECLQAGAGLLVKGGRAEVVLEVVAQFAVLEPQHAVLEGLVRAGLFAAFGDHGRAQRQAQRGARLLETAGFV